MSMLESNIAEAMRVLEMLRPLEGALQDAATMVRDCLRGGNKLLICGNGGSAADAAHLATELVVRYQRDRRPYPAIALTETGGTLTAIGNDYDFEQIFARQVQAFGQRGDVLLAMSTSGRSPNIVRALEEARRRELASIALLGCDGGTCRDLAQVQLIVPHDVTARVQEAHKLLYHTLCEMIEETLAREDGTLGNR